jgi:DDE superfamily endonuclease
VPAGLDQRPDRCQAVGVPDQVSFATKPNLARRMLARALDAGVPAAWVTGDEVYGADPGLRAELETRSIGYVLAVACDHRVVAAGDSYRADDLPKRVPAGAWQQVSCGRGAKGHRLDDWAFIRLDHRDPSPDGQGQRWLLVRRNPRPASWPSTTAGHPTRCRWPPWSGSPDNAGGSRCVNHSALIYADWRHDLGSHPGLVALSRPSGGGCTSQAGGIGAGGARRAGRCRRG